MCKSRSYINDAENARCVFTNLTRSHVLNNLPVDSSDMTIPKLFTPIQVGKASLRHRVVLAPLTRFRAHENHVHSDIAIEYYSQRASVPGSLLISEAVFIAPQAGGLPHVPGLWSDEQVAIWKRVGEIRACITP